VAVWAFATTTVFGLSGVRHASLAAATVSLVALAAMGVMAGTERRSTAVVGVAEDMAAGRYFPLNLRGE
jgi:hypothetical protein